MPGGTMEEYTFAQWAIRGRRILPGERAQHFTIPPDGSRGLGLFTYEQTDDLDLVPDETWQRITAEEYEQRRREAKAARDAERRKAQAKPPRAIIAWNAETGQMRIWVGNNDRAIKWIKGRTSPKFTFDLKTHRWRARVKDPMPYIERFIEAGFDVDTADVDPNG